MKLTRERLIIMKDGEQFATGVGTYPELIDKEVRWVAVRGEGYYDWCIYYHHSHKDVHTVAKEGDKRFSEEIIKRLVPCNDEAYSLYRR